jgi:hypothetical protein
MSEERTPVPGLTDVSAEPLARHPIRTREGATTRSAWRLAATSAQGPGAIVLVEVSSAESFYRGEGVFLGWEQERLAEAWRALLPEPVGADPEMAQLG